MHDIGTHDTLGAHSALGSWNLWCTWNGTHKMHGEHTALGALVCAAHKGLFIMDQTIYVQPSLVPIQ